MDCRQCSKATSTPVSASISCDALLAEGSIALPTPLRFPLRYSQLAGSPDLLLHMGHADTAFSPLDLPELLVSPSTASDSPPSDNVTAQANVLSVSAESPSLSLEGIRNAQATGGNLQPVIKALTDRVKPPHDSLRDYPEEARILLAQWDSLVLEDDVLYRRYHYPDDTTKYLQVVIPTVLRRPYVERLHADIGHFG